MQEIKHKLVNWVEGMDVSSAHFRQTENYFIERLYDNLATRLTRYNYGLLPSFDGHTASSEFDISERVTGKVEIKLRRCNALTSGGCRISYNPEQQDCIIYTHSFEQDKQTDAGTAGFWDVILSVEPFRRIPSGVPNEEETPPRHPDSMETYRLSVTPQGHTNYDRLGLYHLIIGRIRQHDGRYKVDANYIPPCTQMGSHPELQACYKRFGNYLNDVERASKIIVSKVRNRSHNSPVALHIASLCEDLMRYIAAIYFSYRNTGCEAAPVEIVNYFSTLAHIAYVGLQCAGKTDKEDLLRYFYEWSDVNPGSFEELLTETLSIIYDHNAIRPIMIQVESFMHTLSELWVKLSALEYIGQHKENIVVSERSLQPDAPRKSGGWTILD
ncbi:MAG: type VI secretion system membrane-associated complex protein TssK [Dysgonamonadaceae bacterium]|jgi:hypothetical protein|nr:type VI secretion system membrane-associated complex protein TssK [Dysgonamonadaceae bacterium]